MQNITADLGTVETQTTVNKNSVESNTGNTHIGIIQELQKEKDALERRLRDAEENCESFEKKLRETTTDFEDLKQNLEEAEQIELQNDALVQRLQAMSEELAEAEKLKERFEANASALRHKDELVRIYGIVALVFPFVHLSWY